MATPGCKIAFTCCKSAPPVDGSRPPGWADGRPRGRPPAQLFSMRATRLRAHLDLSSMARASALQTSAHCFCTGDNARAHFEVLARALCRSLHAAAPISIGCRTRPCLEPAGGGERKPAGGRLAPRGAPAATEPPAQVFPFADAGHRDAAPPTDGIRSGGDGRHFDSCFARRADCKRVLGSEVMSDLTPCQ